MNTRTTSGQISITEIDVSRRLETASQRTIALGDQVVTLSGNFHLQSASFVQVDDIVRDFLVRLEFEKKLPEVVFELESKITLARTITSTLESCLRERYYPFNLFNITRPIRFSSSTANAYSILAWSVGFRNVSNDSMSRQATKVTRRDFERLRTAEDCVSFSKTWGRLGPPTRDLYFISQSEISGVSETWTTLFESKLWPEHSAWDPSQPFRIPLTGEPLDAWLWHSERLRSWRILLQPLNKDRSVERAIAEIERFSDVIPNPSKAGSPKAHFVRPSAIDGFRSVFKDEISTMVAEPWTYALHQEGGEFYFAGPEFADLRLAMKNVRSKSGPANLEAAIKSMITKLLRRTLEGHVHLLPQIGIADREVIQADSLLAWLYLEFAREFAFPLGQAKAYVKCIVCGTIVEESPHARNKRLYCGGSCQKLKLRHGLEEAQRRVKTL